jgi:hypothetical protein
LDPPANRWLDSELKVHMNYYHLLATPNLLMELIVSRLAALQLIIIMSNSRSVWH